MARPTLIPFSGFPSAGKLIPVVTSAFLRRLRQPDEVEPELRTPFIGDKLEEIVAGDIKAKSKLDLAQPRAPKIWRFGVYSPSVPYDDARQRRRRLYLVHDKKT